MTDYVKEINTALGIKGSKARFESLDEVSAALEEKRDEKHDKALKYSGLAASLLGAGFLADSYSDVFEPALHSAGDVLDTDELGYAGLVTAIAISTVPAYIANSSKEQRDRLDKLLYKLETEEFDDSSAEFAYKVTNAL